MKLSVLLRLLFATLVTSSSLVFGAKSDFVNSNVSYKSVTELSYTAPDHTLAYGKDELQFGYLWLPKDKSLSSKSPYPLLVFIHGGCWLNAFDAKHTFAFATALANEGFAVWSLEYRRTGDAGGGWPGTFNDIKAGINFVGELKPYNIDSTKIHLIGHSAGGHLALLAANTMTNSKNITIASVSGLAAITNVENYARGNNSCQKATPKFMGGQPDQPEFVENYQQASPGNYPIFSDTLLFQGGVDSIVPDTQAMNYASNVYIERTAGHFDWIHPHTRAYDALIARLKHVTQQ